MLLLLSPIGLVAISFGVFCSGWASSSICLHLHQLMTWRGLLAEISKRSDEIRWFSSVLKLISFTSNQY